MYLYRDYHDKSGLEAWNQRVSAPYETIKLTTISPTLASDAAAIEATITPETRLIWVETPGNPLLRIADLAAIAEIGKRRDLSPSPTTRWLRQWCSGRRNSASTSSFTR